MAKILVMALGLIMLVAATCQACPYCDSEIGVQVRAGIFNGDFLLNAGLTLLPLSAFLADRQFDLFQSA